MSDWWNGLDMLMRILYCIAVPASVIFLIQTAISLLGFGDAGSGIDISDTSGLDTGVDITGDINDDIADPDDFSMFQDGSNPLDYSSLRLFTLQGLIAFFTVFSWTSIISISSGTNELLGVVIGAVLGIAVMFLIAKLIQTSRKLTESGNIDINNCIGETASVYIPIPPNGAGYGKVTLKVQGQFREFDALTQGSKQLPSNLQVRVIDIRGDMLVVEADN